LNDHPQFDFDAPNAPDGYKRWQAQRYACRQELAERLGLPLGRGVEVWLKDGVLLRGLLNLAEEPLFVEADRMATLELVVDKIRFRPSEIESCVRLDP
jgi:hypothetical protein